ncbi:MAG TPA: amidohydrolase family protein [Candidatus Binataceae bacterium]|nr:amidohydrolase family protein [Candidatus Binataceae bacterium]
MAYVEGQTIHDADAHIMEAPTFLDGYVEERYAREISSKNLFSALGEKSGRDLFAIVRGRHDDPAWRAKVADEILLHKNYEALGSWRREDRPQALDRLGFASQLVFTTMFLSLLDLEHKGDPAMRTAVARGFNRAMVDFCAVDRRLLASCYVPLADFAEAETIARDAIAIGAKALLIPSRCPKGHSPSHIGFDPVWAQAQEAGLPILFHVGGGGQLISPDYFVNGMPPVPDFHGGDGNFRSVDYMAIPYPPMQTLATMIFDRVLDRFPRLMFGVIEQGALWVPGWMRSMDSAFVAFIKNEDRLKQLSMKPSEFVRRQVRVTPYPAEDTGWIIANSGDEVCMFSSDFPHVEGGRNPLRRFEDAMRDTPEAAKRRFYCDNFIDLMGNGLVPELRHPTMGATAN